MTETTPDRQSGNTEPQRDNPGSDNPQTAPSAEGDTAPTQQTPGDSSDASMTISDDQLPEDVRPGKDNPLAEPPDEDDQDKGLSVGPEGPVT
jgi:hypothetical protein